MDYIPKQFPSVALLVSCTDGQHLLRQSTYKGLELDPGKKAMCWSSGCARDIDCPCLQTLSSPLAGPKREERGFFLLKIWRSPAQCACCRKRISNQFSILSSLSIIPCIQASRQRSGWCTRFGASCTLKNMAVRSKELALTLRLQTAVQ